MENPISETNLLDVPISYFEPDQQRDTFANVPTQQTTLRHIVSTDAYRPLIEAIRAETDPTKQGELKKQLPAITPVALLRHRKRHTPFAEKISQQWPLLIGDVDKKDNPDVDMAELKTHLARLPYVLTCAYSVRGGLWFVVRLPDNQTPETLAAHSRYLQKLFSEKFGVELDKSKGGNPTDLRFVSYDTTPYTNENATIMSGTYTPPKPKPRPTSAYRFDYSRFNKQDAGYLLSRLVRFTESAGEGQRHERLLKAAITAGGYIEAGHMDEETAVHALEAVASEWPTFSKSQKTIQDGIRYGRQNPIHADNPPGKPAHPEQLTTLLQPETPRPAIRAETLTERIPVTTLQPDESQIEQKPPGVKPCASAKAFHKWQRQHKYFSRMGLASLNH